MRAKINGCMLPHGMTKDRPSGRARVLLVSAPTVGNVVPGPSRAPPAAPALSRAVGAGAWVKGRGAERKEWDPSGCSILKRQR